MKEKFRYFLWALICGFILYAGIISKFSEFIFISHSYLFALISLLIFLISSLWLIFTQSTINRETFNPIVWITIIVFILLIFTSQVRYDSIVETYRMIAPIFLFLTVINLVRDKKEQKIFTYFLVFFGIIVGILSYIQFYFPNFGMSALTSIWGYQNTFAAFLVLLIMLSFGIYLEEKNKNIKMLLSTIPMFFIFLLFLTVSRGGYIALLIASRAIIVASILSPPKTPIKLL